MSIAKSNSITAYAVNTIVLRPRFSTVKGLGNKFCLITLISLINVEVRINVEGAQKLPNH